MKARTAWPTGLQVFKFERGVERGPPQKALGGPERLGRFCKVLEP